MGSDMSSSVRFTASMAIFGSIGLVVRFIPLPAVEIALLRGLIGCGCLSLLACLRREGLGWPAVRAHLPVLVLSGAALSGNWIFLFQAFKHTTLSNAMLCYYTAPLFLVLISRAALKERISAPKLACIAGSMAGMVLITLGAQGAGMGPGHRMGILFGLLAAMCYASLMFLNTLMPGLSGLPRTLVQLLLATLLLAPCVAASEGVQGASLLLACWPWLATLGVVHTAIGFHLFFTGLKGLKSQTIALLGYVDPLVALALSTLVLRERLDGLQWAGGVLILGSTLAGQIVEWKRTLPGAEEGPGA